jgi:inosose dehydratase
MNSKITVATAPCSWGVWYADGRPSGTPWNIFLDGAAKAGYKSLELGPPGYLPKDSDILNEVLASRGMSVCAGTASIQFEKFRAFREIQKDIENLCSVVAALNARYIVAMDESDVGEFSEKKSSIKKDAWKIIFSIIKDLGVWTREEFNVETVFHPHVKTLIETEKEIADLLDFCEIMLCFDTGHHAYVNGGCEYGDSSALDFIKKYSSRIAYLHLKNVDGAVRKKVRDENLSSDKAFDLDVMCDLEKGIIDYKKLKDILDDIQYEGIAVIEMDMPNAAAEKAYEAAKRNLEYLQKIRMIL